MVISSSWSIEQTRILTRPEIATVIRELKRKARRSVNSRMDLVIFRMATCCGLRASEICGLKLAHVHAGGIAKPYLDIPKTLGKGGKARRVPLWWDAQTLADIESWKERRQQQGAKSGDPFVCTQARSAFGNPLHRNGARRRFICACKVLGEDRSVTIHDGRHSFISHALAGGRTLAEVKSAAGHASIATTSVYLHVAVEDDGSLGDLFGFAGGSVGWTPARPTCVAKAEPIGA